jgi:hypothetical protein
MFQSRFAWTSSQVRLRALAQPRRSASGVRRATCVLLGAFLLHGFGSTLGARPASAQSAENVAAARALGAEGVQLAQEGKCDLAIERLNRAEQLYHAPTILVELGYCQCELGQLVEGTEALNRVVRENLGANPPPAFVSAQERARSLLARYSPKLAKLVIHVRAPEGASFEVRVDDKPVPMALLGAARPTDPGTRLVSASGTNVKPAQAQVSLSEGGSAEVELVLEAQAPAPNDGDELLVPLREGEPGPARRDTPAEAATESSRVPAYISLGVGGLGIAAGTYFGLSALSKQSTLDEVCDSDGCPEGTQSDIDSLERNANLATVGFGVGIVGIGLGVYFLLSGDSGEETAHCAQTPCVTPLVGLDYLGMEGVF